MHADELAVDTTLVRRLLREQYPSWAELPIERVASSGTVNAMFRLGNNLVMRLPFVTWADDPALEVELLRILAPRLATPIPRVVATGAAGRDYPFSWSVLEWLPGAPPAPGSGGPELARALLAFVAELGAVDAPGTAAEYRRSLHELNDDVRECLARSRPLLDSLDFEAIEHCWAECLAAAPWAGPLRWTHGDLLPGNILVDESGRLTAILDFGAAGLRDPAADLMGVWSLLDADGREFVRQAHGLGEGAWHRARGWALSQAIIALPYYIDTNPGMVAVARQALAQLTRER